MIKKKGSIVPKYLVRSIEKKAQYLVTFGCDVEINMFDVKSLPDTAPYCVIYFNEQKGYVYQNRNKKLIKGLCFDQRLSISTPDREFNYKGK